MIIIPFGRMFLNQKDEDFIKAHKFKIDRIRAKERETLPDFIIFGAMKKLKSFKINFILK
jgi:hypothetical protein